MFHMIEMGNYKIYRPNNAWWNYWKQNKETIKSAGVAVTRISGKFIVIAPSSMTEQTLKDLQLFKADEKETWVKSMIRRHDS